MKNIDQAGLKLCNYQAEIFEKSLAEYECSSKIFIRRFMNSKIARRIDKTGTLFDATSTSAALKEIEEEYGPSTYGKEKFSTEEMRWIGYIYRYWAYTHENTSRKIYKLIKPAELRKLYFPYHSLDPAQAIERIIEANDIKTPDCIYDIPRCVEILREVRTRN